MNGGWQPYQSLLAIGSGGFFGVGLGNSFQKQLWLPEPQNDFIFAIVCEELGFVGGIAVIALFIALLWRGITIAKRAPDLFSSLLVTGLVAKVAIQALLNIAVVTTTIPTTGIALPFFSYGGTALIMQLAEMGIVLSVSRYSSQEKV
jgi:cell division protein FtsW